eukprot:654706-Rhodomonas_salina.2
MGRSRSRWTSATCGAARRAGATAYAMPGAEIAYCLPGSCAAMCGTEIACGAGCGLACYALCDARY